MKNKLFIIILFFLSCSSNNTEEKKNIVISEKNIYLEATTYYNNDQYHKALILYNQLIKIDSLKGEYYYKRGNCKAFLNNYKESTLDYEKALALKYEKTKNIYFNMGLNYAIIKNDSLALEYFLLAHQLDPNNSKIKNLIKETKEVINLSKKY